jgi:hypothetical protein
MVEFKNHGYVSPLYWGKDVSDLSREEDRRDRELFALNRARIIDAFKL